MVFLIMVYSHLYPFRSNSVSIQNQALDIWLFELLYFLKNGHLKQSAVYNKKC